MANHMVTATVDHDVVDKRRTLSAGNAATANAAGTAANIDDITSLRTRLTAVSATAYSAERLDTMTVNDMLYALRLADEAASI